VIDKPTRSIIFACTEWCGPCKSLDIEGLKSALPDVHVQKIDVEKDVDFAQKHQIRSVPTAIFIKEDEVVHKVAGAQSVDGYVELARSAFEGQ
jgi:thioredoxin-like negative regulator of GroEL